MGEHMITIVFGAALLLVVGVLVTGSSPALALTIIIAFGLGWWAALKWITSTMRGIWRDEGHCLMCWTGDDAELPPRD